MKMKAVLAFLALMVDFCRGWCVGIGQNPTFKGKPLIQQLSDLSSVRVSWEGLVDYRECADQFLVSYWIKGDLGKSFQSRAHFNRDKIECN